LTEIDSSFDIFIVKGVNLAHSLIGSFWSDLKKQCRGTSQTRSVVFSR